MTLRHHCLCGALALVFALVPDASVQAAEPVTLSAVSGLAEESARAWAEDARLIYVENDTDLDPSGQAERWGFLFWSDRRDELRAYSLSEGKIEVATDPALDFPALPVGEPWIDSDQALVRAEDEGGRDYREKHAGTVQSVVLVRGVFHEKHPERTTWTVFYTSETSPALWVVIDAQSGDLVRRWEG